MEMLRLGCVGVKGVVVFYITHLVGNVDFISIYCVYVLYRNNCFRLSVEDSFNCCRQCMMIRQTKTNHRNMSLSMTVE